MPIYLLTSDTALPEADENGQGGWEPPPIVGRGRRTFAVSSNRKRAVVAYTDGAEPVDAATVFTRELVDDSDDPAMRVAARWQDDENELLVAARQAWRHEKAWAEANSQPAPTKPTRRVHPAIDAAGGNSLVKELARPVYDDDTPRPQRFAQITQPIRSELNA